MSIADNVDSLWNIRV